ncbi:hypothetical protein J2T20_004166 [Paenibacillus wynnii]|nr:hypothetical protein [Paenibacillus wynnii]
MQENRIEVTLLRKLSYEDKEPDLENFYVLSPKKGLTSSIRSGILQKVRGKMTGYIQIKGLSDHGKAFFNNQLPEFPHFKSGGMNGNGLPSLTNPT